MAKAAKPKQTWTSNEVKALIDAVKHHGIGKWKAILDDPVYSSALGNRSNVDLKDKWRNICGSENGPTRGMMTERTSRRSSKKRRAPPYDDMIFEPLRSFKDPNGTDLDGIDSYLRVHERYKRKDGETSQAGDDAVAVIIDNRDKEQAGPQNVIYFCQDLNEEPVEQVGPLNLNKELVEPAEPLPAETQDAASAAAVQIAMSENLESRVIKAYQDKNKLADLVDESVAMLMLVKDLYDKCRRNGTVILPP